MQSRTCSSSPSPHTPFPGKVATCMWSGDRRIHCSRVSRLKYIPNTDACPDNGPTTPGAKWKFSAGDLEDYCATGSSATDCVFVYLSTCTRPQQLERQNCSRQQYSREIIVASRTNTSRHARRTTQKARHSTCKNDQQHTTGHIASMGQMRWNTNVSISNRK